jgi:RNA polymerase sigma-70 factor (ECF subfamily)
MRHARRHIGFDGEAAEPPSGHDVVGDLAGAARRSMLRAAVGALPLRYREALVLCVLHEMTYDEAARVLDVPVGTVRSRLHRARQMLSERVHRAEEPAAASTWRLWRKFS